MNRKAGEFRHRITVQRKSISRDSNGIEVESWTPIHTDIPAAYRSLSANERMAGGKRIGSVTAQFMVDAAFDITASDRIVMYGEIWDLDEPEPDATLSRVLRIRATRGLTDGG